LDENNEEMEKEDSKQAILVNGRKGSLGGHHDGDNDNDNDDVCKIQWPAKKLFNGLLLLLLVE
jgi:hypothetical protein